MRLTSLSEDVREAMAQTVERFGAGIQRLSRAEPPFGKMTELAFCFDVAHPVGLSKGKGRASYSREKRIFFSEANLDYSAWIGESWAERVRAVERAAQTALSSVHKTRLSTEERSRLSRLVEDVAEELVVSPPEHLAPLKCVYAYEDEVGRMVAIGFQPPSTSSPAAHRLLKLQPSEIQVYLQQRSRR